MKQSFDIDVAMERIEEAVRPYPKAMLFELADDGHDSPFEQVIACMLSIRTRDEVSLVAARQLFAHARTAREMSTLSPAEIRQLIHSVTFHEPKARQIHAIAREVVEEYDGEVPCEGSVIQSFPGIGPKCTNLTLGIACGQPRIGVDIHVHRITNRWGYVQAKSPEATISALEAKLPHRYWVDINRLLVPFGKHICTGRRPHCSTCVVLDMCDQVGVSTHR